MRRLPSWFANRATERRGFGARKVIKEELILKMELKNHETNEAVARKRVWELAAFA